MRHAIPSLLALLVASPALTGQAVPDDILPAVRSELARHPAARLADVYKLVYQASMGPAHFGLDSAMARTWLDGEWADAAGPRPPEPLLDTIAPGGAVVRLDLRPFRAAGGTEAAVVQAFVASAHAIRPDTTLLVTRWRQVATAARMHGLPWRAAQVEAFLDRQRRKGFPAPEHSATYVARYHPAYRVLGRAEADALLESIGR